MLVGTENRIVEREGELRSAVALLEAALTGDGRCLVLQGPAGVGKTTLLDALLEQASRRGFAVLRSRGAEREQAFAYGIARQLLERHLRELDDAERSVLLSGAGAHAAPVLDLSVAVVAPSAIDASFAALHGLYWLTADLAANAPLVLAVDDLHWSDAPSIRWIDYTMRRLEGVPLVLALAARAAEPGTDELVDAVIDDPLVDTITVSPLSSAAVTELVKASAPNADPAFCDSCYGATAGNPLFLRELLAAVEQAGIPTTAAGAAQLEVLGPRTIASRTIARLRRHGEAAQRVARAIAVLGADASVRTVAELTELPERDVGQIIDRLVASGMLVAEDGFEFLHPVVRTAVYEAIPPAERLRLHKQAARVLTHVGSSPERIAPHLLASEVQGDSNAADLLRAAAASAQARGAPDLAARCLQRALTEIHSADASLTHDLGVALLSDRDPDAFEQLRRAIELMPDVGVRGRWSLELIRALGVAGRPREALEFARGSLDRGIDDATLAVRIESELIAMAWRDFIEEAVERLSRLERSGLPEELTPFVAVHSGLKASRDARPVAEAIALAQRGLEGGLLLEEQSSLPFVILITLVWNDELEQPRVLCDAAMSLANQMGSRHLMVNAGAFGGLAALRAGDLGGAAAAVRSSFEFARQSAMPGSIDWAWALAILLDALRERGALDEAQRLLEVADALGELPDEFTFVMLRESRGRMRTAQGELSSGLADLLEVGRRWERFGLRNPSVSSWRSDAALGLERLGRHAEALELAEQELEIARQVGAPRASGIALRTVGTLRRDLGMLARAAATLESSPARLEYGKALYELGAFHRRASSKREARGPLLGALDIAHRCTAAALADRVRTELDAIGARPRRPYVSGAESLTPGELRIARMAAAGQSNKEIAQTLYLTLRTVETHLTHVYRKLDISSRTSLAAALNQEVANDDG